MTTLEEVFLHLGEEEEVDKEEEQEAGGCAAWFRYYHREAAKFTDKLTRSVFANFFVASFARRNLVHWYLIWEQMLGLGCP
jgi:hypothetical protein